MTTGLRENGYTLKQKIYQRLFNAILTGKLKPGERLLEEEISSKLKVSRTPVREAIKELEMQKLVTITPYKGAVVSQATYEEARDLLEVCTVLENYFCRKATEKCTDNNIKQIMESLEKYEAAYKDNNLEEMMIMDFKFHTLISEISGNKAATEVYNIVRARMNIIRLMTLPFFDRGKLSLLEHMEIAKAIEERSPEKATEKALKHMEEISAALQNIKNKELNIVW